MDESRETMDENGIVASLRIMFDGVPSRDVARLLAEAFGAIWYPELWWHLVDCTPVSVVYAQDVLGIHDILKREGLVFTGNDDAMQHLLNELCSSEPYDSTADAMYEYVSEWVLEYVSKHNLAQQKGAMPNEE